MKYFLLIILISLSLYSQDFFKAGDKVSGYVVMMKNTLTTGYGRTGMNVLFYNLDDCVRYKNSLLFPENKICVNINDMEKYRELNK